MKDNLITIIGSSYFQPISVLLASIGQVKSTNDVQVSSHENGFSSSVCLLAVACLESYIMRVRYIKSDDDTKHASQYLQDIYSDFPYGDEIKEIYVLRDIITHNHLWDISYYINSDGKMEKSSIKKYNREDKKYLSCINREANTTKKLSLTVNSIKIGYPEVKSVLITMWKILLFLENQDKELCYVSHVNIKYKGELRKFSDLIEEMQYDE